MGRCLTLRGQGILYIVPLELFSLLPPSPLPFPPPQTNAQAALHAATPAPQAAVGSRPHVRLMFRLSLATNWSRGLSVSEELATCR